MNKKLFLQIIITILFLTLIIFSLALFQNPYKSLKNITSKGKTIIAFGNSITAGSGIDKKNAFPELLQEELGEKIINAGVPGNTTEDALRRIEKDVLANEPRIVLVEFGGNDFLQKVPGETTQANLEKIVNLIQEKGAIVILMSVPSCGSSINKICKKIAKEKKCVYAGNILKGIIAHPDLMADSIHPNEKGHELIAKKILKILRPVIELNGMRQ